MELETGVLVDVLLALGAALVMSFAATPIIKLFAQKVGAMDVPNEARRVHDHPIPRMGGLAIFLGFIFSVVLFGAITPQVQGILLGTVVIVAVGAIDDVVPLSWWVKLLAQLAAAVVAVLHGVVIENFMNPIVFDNNVVLHLGFLSVPITVFWIVAITNSVNLIDGLDGLAAGVSTISGVTMLVIALMVADATVAVLLAALVGACIGFLPYNLNPAKIFMGDTGALLLGYVLSTASILGLFKFYAVVSFAVPFLVLAVPLFDTVFAFVRRVLTGKNPMKPDRGHFHHRLLDMGLTQKQAVAVLYVISAFLGLAAVVLTTSGELKALILIAAFIAALVIAGFLMRSSLRAHEAAEKAAADARSAEDAPAEADPRLPCVKGGATPENPNRSPEKRVRFGEEEGAEAERSFRTEAGNGADEASSDDGGAL